ncbi:MAG: tRNA (adenosine(37)-N6)-dimethylallyltransferase MiaA [Bacteroidota bacterium]|nr:tRNA (adenosine(37)-N6)-dimethylallyltransferase MiaA [Bacteroidota bacterium]
MRIEVITGPTASGKTEVSLARANSDSAIEIVNADASLFYEGFDIGTAKPSRELRSRIQHHLIDILEPSERFNASDYAKIARTTIRSLIAEGKTPIVVGGTGFYIDALFFGISSVEADEIQLQQARSKVSAELEAEGFVRMLDRLQNIDPIMYEQIAREKNPRRLERAWEFYYATGIPLGKARQEKAEPFEFEPSFTVIELPKEELRARIVARIDTMLEAGWLKEVENLLSSGVTVDMPAMNAIGYRELAAVIGGEKLLEQAREEIIIRTRQYAKRQVTWMKRYTRS